MTELSCTSLGLQILSLVWYSVLNCIRLCNAVFFWKSRWFQWCCRIREHFGELRWYFTSARCFPSVLQCEIQEESTGEQKRFEVLSKLRMQWFDTVFSRKTRVLNIKHGLQFYNFNAIFVHLNIFLNLKSSECNYTKSLAFMAVRPWIYTQVWI